MGSTVVLSSSVSLDYWESTNSVFTQVGQSPLPALWWQKCLCRDQNEHQNSVFWYEIRIQNTFFFFNPLLELFRKKRHWQVKRTYCASFSSVIFHFIHLIKHFHCTLSWQASDNFWSLGSESSTLQAGKALTFVLCSPESVWALVSMLTEDEDTVWSANFKTSMFYA